MSKALDTLLNTLAEKMGMGLLKSDGETLAPRELIQPAA